MSPTVDAALMFHLTHATLSMFVALPSRIAAPQMRMASDVISPSEVRFYDLEDPSDRSTHLFEYDAICEAVPGELGAYLESCLNEALQKHAVVAWFAFEGSPTLEPEVSTSIYAIADASGIALAIDDEVRTSARARARARRRYRRLSSS